jgi:hypothetical protein
MTEQPVQLDLLDWLDWLAFLNESAQWTLP